jgi:hypothetical protein
MMSLQNFNNKFVQATEDINAEEMPLVTHGRLNTSLRAIEEYLTQLCCYLKGLNIPLTNSKVNGLINKKILKKTTWWGSSEI